jgi:hypothetical protein
VDGLEIEMDGVTAGAGSAATVPFLLPWMLPWLPVKPVLSARYALFSTPLAVLLDDGGAAAWKAPSSRSATASNPLVDGADLERGAGAAAAAAGVEAAAVLLDDICCNIGAVEAMRGRRR